MKMRAALFFFFLVAMTGCNSQIKEFVGSGAKRDQGDSQNPPVAGSKPGYKISPSANKVVGTQVNSQFAITPTQRSVQGSQVKSTFSIQARSTQ
jgi:hypothetical protein